jgi:hypothetical protein
VATAFHLLGKVFEPYDVGAGRFGLVSIFALGEHCDTHCLACAVRQDRRTAYYLVGLAWINAEIHRHIDALREFCRRQFLDEPQRFINGVIRVGVDFLACVLLTFR